MLKCVRLTGIFAYSCSVFLGERGHGWQGALTDGESMKDPMMNTHRLVFSKHTVGTQLGEPDIEEIMALCLTGRKEREKTANRNSVKRGTGTKWSEIKLFRRQSAAQEREVISFYRHLKCPGISDVLCRVPWGGRGCLQHPGLCVWISCWWTWQPGWHPESHGVSLSESKNTATTCLLTSFFNLPFQTFTKRC